MAINKQNNSVVVGLMRNAKHLSTPSLIQNDPGIDFERFFITVVFTSWLPHVKSDPAPEARGLSQPSFESVSLWVSYRCMVLFFLPRLKRLLFFSFSGSLTGSADGPASTSLPSFSLLPFSQNLMFGPFRMLMLLGLNLFSEPLMLINPDTCRSLLPPPSLATSSAAPWRCTVRFLCSVLALSLASFSCALR